MNELALFAGAGGGILGGKLLGWTPVGAVEIEKYPREILMQRQRDRILAPFPVWDDVCPFDGKPWRGIVDVVSGGFPCQDVSVAGKGAGIAGTSSGLWSHMHRIICEIRPSFAFLENSPMLTARGLGTVLGDLAESGYNAAWLVLGADDVGAPHVRKRIWVLAHDTHEDRLQYPPPQHNLQYSAPGELLDVARTNYSPGKQWIPTPTCRGLDGGHHSRERLKALNLFPTPTCQDAKNNGSPSQQARNTPPLNVVAGGALNPQWVEWLMGWPLGWTDSKPLEMDKFLSWLQEHSQHFIKY